MARCRRCAEEAVPKVNPALCATHHAERRERQKREAAKPRCANHGCNQSARMHDTLCGACANERSREVEAINEEVGLLIELRDCTTLDEVKDFIALNILPKLGA